MFSEFEPELDPSRRNAALEVELRGASRADAEQVAAIRHERHGGDRQRHERWARRSIARALGSPNEQCFLVAAAEGRLLGYATAGKFMPGPSAPRNVAPSGYYLRGVVVARAARRRGVGRRLTEARLSWIAERADDAFYCVNRVNLASMRLHEHFGFVELSRDFHFPRIDFGPDGGVLYVLRGLGRR